MTARQGPADRGRRIARSARAELLRDLRARRLDLGLSQAAVAAAVGISSSMYGRLERDEIEAPRLEDLWAIGAVLGLDLRLNAFPGGEPLADRVQVRLLAAIRTRIHPALGWRTEVPLPIQGDRRAWDAVALTPDGWTGFEASAGSARSTPRSAVRTRSSGTTHGSDA